MSDISLKVRVRAQRPDTDPAKSPKRMRLVQVYRLDQCPSFGGNWQREYVPIYAILKNGRLYEPATRRFLTDVGWTPNDAICIVCGVGVVHVRGTNILTDVVNVG